MKLVYTFVFALFLVNLSAQSFTLETTTGTYAELTNAMVLNGDQTWDEPDVEDAFSIQSITPITIFGITYNEFEVLDNGVSFLNSMEDKFLSVEVGADLCDRAYDTDLEEPMSGAQSFISLKVESGFTKMEFKNAGFFDEKADGMGNDVINFQIWFNNSTGVIEYHFGPSSVTNPGLSYVNGTGLSPNITQGDGTTFDIDRVVYLTGAPNAPTYNEEEMPATSSLSGTVADGTIYSFTPLSTSTTTLVDQSNILLAPNPAREVLNVSALGVDLTLEHYTILNAQGKALRSSNFAQNQINIADLSTGFYVLQLETSKGVVNKKFMVH